MKKQSKLTKTMTCSAGAGGCAGRATASASAAAAPVASILPAPAAPPPITSRWQRASNEMGDGDVGAASVRPNPKGLFIIRQSAINCRLRPVTDRCVPEMRVMLLCDGVDAVRWQVWTCKFPQPRRWGLECGGDDAQPRGGLQGTVLGCRGLVRAQLFCSCELIAKCVRELMQLLC